MTSRAAATWALGVSVATVVVAVALLANFRIADSDFFWHVRNGLWILDNGEIPSTDVYSHTARGEYYAYYSWLAEVLAAVLYRMGDVPLIIHAKAAGCAVGFLLLAWLAHRRGARGFAIAWALLWCLLLVRFRLYARPEIFTLFLLPLVDLLALDYLERGRRWRLVALPIIACIWSNLHPYVILAPAVLGAHVVGEAVSRARGRRGAAGAGSPYALAGATLAAAVASLANPYGWRIYSPALKLVEPGAIADLPTREWLPPTFEDFSLFFVLAALGTGVVLATVRRARIGDLLMWAGLLALALTSLRNIGVFAVVSCGILARHLHLLASTAAPHARRLLPSVARLQHPATTGLLFIAVTAWTTATLLSPAWSVLHIDQSQHYRFGAGLARDSAPVAALDFIEGQRLEGPLFNSWAFGGYVIWRAWPRLAVSIDGRQMVYERFLAQLQSAGVAATLRALDIRLGLVSYRDEPSIRAFREDPSFRLVFFDDLSLVFVRTDAAHGLVPYGGLKPEDLGLEWAAHAPSDMLAAWVAEAERATRESPDCSRAWMLLGALSRRAGDLERSMAALAVAIELDPYQKAYHNNLGVALLEAERPEAALREFRAAADLDPRAFSVHYNAALALTALGREREARGSLRRALHRDAERPEAYLMLGALESDPVRARELLRRAVDLSRDPALTRKARRLLDGIEPAEPG